MKLFRIVFIIISFNAFNSWACMPAPGQEVRIKNEILTAVANKYLADISESEIRIHSLKHKYKWQFRDAGYQCHDTDILDAKIQLTYSSFWYKRSCTLELEVNYVRGPKLKDGPAEVTLNIQELSNSCEQNN